MQLFKQASHTLPWEPGHLHPLLLQSLPTTVCVCGRSVLLPQAWVRVPDKPWDLICPVLGSCVQPSPLTGLRIHPSPQGEEQVTTAVGTVSRPPNPDRDTGQLL